MRRRASKARGLGLVGAGQHREVDAPAAARARLDMGPYLTLRRSKCRRAGDPNTSASSGPALWADVRRGCGVQTRADRTADVSS